MRLPRFLTKENPAFRAILGAIGLTGPVWKTVDYEAYIREGYLRCVSVYAAVSMVSKTGSRIGWILKQRKKELDSHDLLTLLGRPNEFESGTRFTEKSLTFYQLAGNSYTLRVQGIKSMPPRYLYQLRPDRVTIDKSGDWKRPVGSYTYTVPGHKEHFAPEDVLHIAEFHPLDDWYGLSKIEVLARRVDISNEIARWNKKIFENEMRIPGILTGSRIGPTDIATFQKLFKEKYQSPDSDNLGGPLVLSGQDLKFEHIAATPKDVDWINGNKLVMREICSTIGVPSQLLGDPDSTTYANYQEARKALYEETVLPLMDLLRDEYNAWLVPLFGDGLYLDYDRDGIEALQESRERKWAYVNAANFLTVNEKREACGYGKIGPEGDVVLVGIGDMALGDALAGAGDITADDDEPKFRPLLTKGLGGFWRGETERKALWQNFERRVAAKEKSFAREMRSWLSGQADRAVDLASSGGTFPEAQFRADSEASYKTTFKTRYRRLYGTALAAGRRMTEGKLYEFDGDDKAVTDLPPALRTKLEGLIEGAAKVITDETVKEIQDVLREATGTNLTTQEIAGALRDKVDGLSGVRSRRIARTETGMLENCGNLDGFKENEFVNRKGWLCSFVEASRDAHIAADGQEVGIDDQFVVGDARMDYPGDRTHGAEAGDVINCLCAVYPVVE